MILLVEIPSINDYRSDPRSVLATVHPCPACKHAPLHHHGAYLRWVYDPPERYQVTIFRLRCPACRRTCSLIPDRLIPYFRYLAAIVQQGVDGWLHGGQSFRALAVSLSGVALPCDQSPTDTLLSLALRPSYQRIHAWVRRMRAVARLYSEALLAWILDLYPDSDAAHLVSVPPTEVTASRSPEAALLVSLVSRIPGPATASPWICTLDRFLLGVLGRIPWRAPPERASPHGA